MIDPPSPFVQQIFYPPASIPGISFRLAEGDDLQALHENCYPDTNWEQFRDHYEYLLRWQANGRCCIVVAEENSRELTRISRNCCPTIVGSGQLFFRGDMAEIAELSVHPTYRNRGIGTALIHILAHIALERKTSILEIGADVDNEAALRLYRRLGFGRDRLLSLPDAQEAIVLRKFLVQGAE